MDVAAPRPTQNWPRRVAVVLVCATFVLVGVGGLVTTLKAGMAVYDWPTTFGHNMFLYPIALWLSGPRDVMVEHGHRLLGALVGLLSIALVAVCWHSEPRRWMRRLAFVALLAVIAQGLLGGMRVRLDARLLALVHGCVGPAFLALTAALAAMHSRWWAEAPRAAVPDGARLPRLATLVAVLAYAQLVLGAVLRHLHQAAWLHIALGLALAAHVAWLAVVALRSDRQPLLRRPAVMLAGLIAVQLALGVSAWVTHHGWPAWFAGQRWAAGYVVEADSLGQVGSATVHMLTGSLIVSVATLLALRSWRLIELPAAPARRAAALQLVSREAAA